MIESSQRLGRHRWTIERTDAWLGDFRRLRIRDERSSERFYALAMLACAVICSMPSSSRHGDRSRRSTQLGRRRWRSRKRRTLNRLPQAVL